MLAPPTSTGLTWVTRRQLAELIAELHPDRTAVVTTTIRELIGKT